MSQPTYRLFWASLSVLLGGLIAAAPTPAAEAPAVPPAGDIFVAPSGNDTNAGASDAPFATLTAARDAARKRIAAGLTQDLHIVIRGGVYEQSGIFELGAQDGGTAEHSVTWAAAPGEKVIISGGKHIAGWQHGAGSLWTTTLPEVKDGKWYFRQLFINGKRAIRARTPNADVKPPYWAFTSTTERPNVAPKPDATVTVTLDHPLGSWSNLADVEMIWFENNDASRRIVGPLDPAKRTVSFVPPQGFYPQRFPGEYQVAIPIAGQHAYFENAIEMLDEPGEWYLDRKTGVLSYWPREGEDLSHAEVIAPVVQKTLLRVAGTEDHPVQNLHLDGLSVEYVDWPLPSTGYMANFGCLLLDLDKTGPGMRFLFMDAALNFENARHCSFTDGAVGHVGDIGIDLRRGTSDIVIKGNDVFGTGGCGIVGGAVRNRDCLPWSAVPKEDEFKGYRVVNNHVHNVGTDYFGAIGIFLTQSQDLLIAHNLVNDVAYSGIVVCGNEDHTNFSKDTKVSYNEIHDVMKSNGDGAGIYVSFPMGGYGCYIDHNLIYDVRQTIYNTGAWGEGGIYLDLSTENFHFENNVVYQTDGNWGTGEPLHFSLSAQEKNTWKDNAFMKSGQQPAPEVLTAARASAGLEAPYREKLSQ